MKTMIFDNDNENDNNDNMEIHLIAIKSLNSDNYIWINMQFTEIDVTIEF